MRLDFQGCECTRLRADFFFYAKLNTSELITRGKKIHKWLLSQSATFHL